MRTAAGFVAGLYDAAALLDRELIILAANPAFGPLAGLRSHALLAQIERRIPFDVLLAVGDPTVRASAELCVATGRAQHLAEKEVQNKAGDRFVTWISFVPVVDEEERVVGVVEIVRDVTGESATHVRLRQMAALAQARADELERAVEHRTRELHAALDEVTRLSRIDPLTGLLNRRAFTEGATQVLSLGRRHHRNAGLLMCDLRPLQALERHARPPGGRCGAGRGRRRAARFRSRQRRRGSLRRRGAGHPALGDRRGLGQGRRRSMPPGGAQHSDRRAGPADEPGPDAQHRRRHLPRPRRDARRAGQRRRRRALRSQGQRPRSRGALPALDGDPPHRGSALGQDEGPGGGTPRPARADRARAGALVRSGGDLMARARARARRQEHVRRAGRRRRSGRDLGRRLSARHALDGRELGPPAAGEEPRSLSRGARGLGAGRLVPPRERGPASPPGRDQGRAGAPGGRARPPRQEPVGTSAPPLRGSESASNCRTDRSLSSFGRSSIASVSCSRTSCFAVRPRRRFASRPASSSRVPRAPATSGASGVSRARASRPRSSASRRASWSS